MALTEPDYERLRSNKHVTVWGGPTGTGAVGITDLAQPDADEINNTGGASLIINHSPSISWNDSDFDIQESETLNDPSYADASTYTEFGAKNYGGGFSYYMPNKYDDNSNNHSLVYDQVEQPRTRMDLVKRIDGATETTVPAAAGDFVSTFRTMTDSWANVWGQPDAQRFTVGYLSRGAAEFWTIVGQHTLSNTAPTFTAGSTGRLQVGVQDRDYSSALSFTSSDPSVIEVTRGGHYKVTGASSDTADVTVTDEAAGTSLVISVTVA